METQHRGASEAADEVLERRAVASKRRPLRWARALSKAKRATLLPPRFDSLSLSPCMHPNASLQLRLLLNFQIQSYEAVSLFDELWV